MVKVNSDSESAKSFSDFDADIGDSPSETSEQNYIDRTFNELSNVEKSLTVARADQKKRTRILLFIFCSLGILVFYLVFGFAQESITKQGFGLGFPDGPDRWTFMLALVWVSVFL